MRPWFLLAFWLPLVALSWQWLLLCVRIGSHSHAVVQLWSIERRSLWRVAGRHLHGRDQLAGPGGEGAAGSPQVLCCVLDQMTESCVADTPVCVCVHRSICSSCGTLSSSWLWSSAPASSFRLAGSTRAPSWMMTLSYRWYFSLSYLLFLLKQYIFSLWRLPTSS